MNFHLPRPTFQAPEAPASAPAAPNAPSSASSPASAPSSTPSSPDTPIPSQDLPTPEPSDGADSSFEFMFSPEGDDPFDPLKDLGLSPPVKAPPEPKPAKPAPPKAEPAAKVTEPAKPQPAATPAPTEATSPPAPQASLDPYDPGALAQHLGQNQEQVVQYVADNLFKLSDKDVEALESDVVGTIPKLLARSFVAAQQNLLMQMSRLIPTMIQRQGEVTKAHSEAESEFYTRWPDLKREQHSDLVLQYARVYGQMHPQATRQERIEAVGPMVMMAAKVVPGAAPSVAPQARPSPMAPTGASGRPPQPSPFVPAGPAVGGATPVTAPQLSAVEAMFAGEET